jgi:3'(2'), 5'-bisphosphate nucleotidase
MSTHTSHQIAIRVVADCCRVTRGVQQRLDDVRKIIKDDRSPVTVADFAVQAIVALELMEEDPSVRIVGEEHAGELRQPEQARVLEQVVEAVRIVRPHASPEQILDAIDHCDHDATASSYWALDPIDGTKGFLRGEQYAIALGWIDSGRVSFGVMGCPNLPLDQSQPLTGADARGCLYVAETGGGAFELAADHLDGEPRPISAATYEPDHPVRVCESVEAAHSKHDDVVKVIETLGAERQSVRIDSQCKYAVVARNQADAYLRLPTRKGYVEKIWDHAAGSLIATEAGATVTDIAGRPLDFTHGTQLEANRGIVCASAGLHPNIIAAIERLGVSAAE